MGTATGGRLMVRKSLISILVPFQSEDPVRIQHWNWLRRYWESHLPNAEIIIGTDPKSKRRKKARPFSKAVAVNNAFKRSKGDIIVILDADAYLDAAVIEHCADRIRAARSKGSHIWFVPYTHLYRLTEQATDALASSDPRQPMVITDPPPPGDVEPPPAGRGSNHHSYGALVMEMPREAFILAGGMDTRFSGWGGEDFSLLCAVDTLWGHYLTTPNDVLHLWHPMLLQGQGQMWQMRVWDGQESPGANDHLTNRYVRARNNQRHMNILVTEREHHGWYLPKKPPRLK